MPSSRTSRNPPWTRDELIVALDLYFKNRNHLPSPDDEQILRTSEFLNRLGGTISNQYKSFRNANSVYMKLANFRAIDPLYVSQGKKGLQRGGKGDRDVWEDFAALPAELAMTATAIRAVALDGGELNQAEGADEFFEGREGRLLARLHLSRERSAKLVTAKKRAVMKEKGSLFCEACGFDFKRRYGIRGQGFMEVHHVVPLYMLRPDTKTKLADLALLCANCHRMIHRHRPWLSLNELRLLLESNG